MKKARDLATHKRRMAEESSLTTEKVSSRKGCLDTAAAAVLGDRALNYGSAEDNFARIAHLQNAYLDIRKVQGEDRAIGDQLLRGSEITPHDVAIMTILVKIARLANTPSHADSWADIAGYAACGAEINKVQY